MQNVEDKYFFSSTPQNSLILYDSNNIVTKNIRKTMKNESRRVSVEIKMRIFTQPCLLKKLYLITKSSRHENMQNSICTLYIISVHYIVVYSVRTYVEGLKSKSNFSLDFSAPQLIKH